MHRFAVCANFNLAGLSIIATGSSAEIIFVEGAAGLAVGVGALISLKGYRFNLGNGQIGQVWINLVQNYAGKKQHDQRDGGVFHQGLASAGAFAAAAGNYIIKTADDQQKE